MSVANFEMHRRFLAALGSGHVGEDLARWYANAYQRSIETGQPLDVCLGLRGAGIRLPSTREKIERRNALLAQALDAVEADNTWQKCELLAQYVKRWPRSHHEAPYLAPVFDVGLSVPSTAGGIYAAAGKPATQ